MTENNLPAYAAPRSPEAIRRARFSRSGHGFDEREVLGYLMTVAGEVEANQAERDALREQVTDLRDQARRLRESTGTDEEVRREISVRAVELLSRAQQAADDAIAEAEQYARDLVMTARAQYRDVVAKAHQTAAQEGSPAEGTSPDEGASVLGSAAPVAGAVASSQAAEPAGQVEYVRTFARVAQAQMRSVIDALAAEVDKLGQVAQTTPATAQTQSTPEPSSEDGGEDLRDEGDDGDVDWRPAVHGDANHAGSVRTAGIPSEAGRHS